MSPFSKMITAVTLGLAVVASVVWGANHSIGNEAVVTAGMISPTQTLKDLELSVEPSYGGR